MGRRSKLVGRMVGYSLVIRGTTATDLSIHSVLLSRDYGTGLAVYGQKAADRLCSIRNWYYPRVLPRTITDEHVHSYARPGLYFAFICCSSNLDHPSG